MSVQPGGVVATHWKAGCPMHREVGVQYMVSLQEVAKATVGDSRVSAKTLLAITAAAIN